MELNLFLKESRRLAKLIRKEPYKKVDTRIAVLGTDSIQYFVMALRYALDRENIHADIYEGEYDGIAMDVMDDDSPLYAFNPDIVILIPDYREIKEYPEALESEESVRSLLSTASGKYEYYWQKISSRLHCQVLQSNVVIPPERLYGNLEKSLPYSMSEFLSSLNETLLKKVSSNVTIIDTDALAANIGKWNWFDDQAYFLSKSGYRLDYIQENVSQYVRQIKAIRGKVRKCLVLDLDNTLWGGIVGDDGWDGIQLDPNNAVGEAYREFQRYILKLKKRGVILAVVSKNDIENAKEPFEKNQNMLLKLDDIASFQANWDDKVTNIKRVAKELNIGTDSLVFFDDNPAEREIVRQYLPEVMVIDVPADAALYKRALDQAKPFEWRELTREDVLRSNSYIENRKRAELQTRFENYDEYLQSLEMKCAVREPNASEVSRFAQLLNKSNQFNLRTQRYTQSEIEAAVKAENKKCLCAVFSDKFSEYGIISCVILEKQDECCFIESWVMSCRVLKRGVELMVFSHILNVARSWNCRFIKGEYLPSAKNQMVCDLYDNLGFELVSENNGNRIYQYHTCKEFSGKYFIEENVSQE